MLKAGSNFNIAITAYGEVYSWGNNFYGQLGLDHNDDQNIPQQIEFFKDKQIKKIKCGNYHTIAITDVGVYSWGSNSTGQLGLGNYNYQKIPQRVDFFKDKQIKEIICGGFHTFAITENGDVYSWGNNTSGQLGLGHNNHQNNPQLVEFFKDKQIKELKCGGFHTIAITEIGDLYSWGFNDYGQLGLGHQRCYQNIPQQVDFFKDKQIKEIICNNDSTFAITDNNDVYSWGCNSNGQLELGHNNNQDVPQRVDFFKDKPSSMLQQANLQIKKIICGSSHAFVITEIGEVYSRGNNTSGQLGLGHNDKQNIPQLVEFFKDKQIKKIKCGGHHTIAITEIGDVYSWGYNYYGQLGLGHRDHQNVPQQIDFFKEHPIIIMISKIKSAKSATFKNKNDFFNN